MSKLIRVTMGLALAAGLLLTVPACNTVEGVGEDTAAAGRGIDRTAEKAKESLSD